MDSNAKAQVPRQRYVSEYLSHFVGAGFKTAEGQPDLDRQFDLLVKILRSGWLTHPPHDPYIRGNVAINEACRPSKNDMYSPQIVCFCDIPEGDLGIHMTKYSQFGLSFSKRFIASKGGCPVLYVPFGAKALGVRLGGQEHLLSDLFDTSVPNAKKIVDAFKFGGESAPKVPAGVELREFLAFLEFRLFCYLKFFDETLSDAAAENFYMEREWRVIGNLEFESTDVRQVFVPKPYVRRLLAQYPECDGKIRRPKW